MGAGREGHVGRCERCAARAEERFRPAPSTVILTKVRIQGYAALPCLALGPDFRQDDGGGWRFRMAAVNQVQDTRIGWARNWISVLLPHDTHGYRRGKTGIAGIGSTGMAGTRRRR
ncbi:hypothetical protein ASE72_08570 [Sphingomonas sp. Leaf20]|nr:hypothetical protein ASE72_08570 [Sphingomonas sp. Leaf20]